MSVEITSYELPIINYQLSEKIDRPKTVNFPYTSRIANPDDTML
jgi:hypothetical protein